MGKISEYASKPPPLNFGDKVIGTDFDDGSTKNFNIAELNTRLNGFDVTVINELSDLGTLVGDAYQVSAGRYVFSKDFDFGTNRIELIDIDGFYTIESTNFTELNYSGTSPFISNATGITGNSVHAYECFILTPNATAISLSDGNSFITRNTVFINCKRPFELDNMSFCSVFDGGALVLGELGAILNNVGVTSLQRPQWNLGDNLNGVALTFSGASSERVIINSLECNMESTESFIEVTADFGGLVSITGGVFQGDGDFFKSGTRDQNDVAISSLNVINVPDSSVFAFSHVDTTSTTTIGTVATPVKLNATWVDVSSARITVDTTGRWTYDDLEDSNITINCALSLDPGAINQQIEAQIWKNGVFVDHTEHQSEMNRGGQLIIFAVVPMTTGDYVEVYIQNNTSTSNIDCSKASFKIG